VAITSVSALASRRGLTSVGAAVVNGEPGGMAAVSTP
jgi:hypothetical protein